MFSIRKFYNSKLMSGSWCGGMCCPCPCVVLADQHASQRAVFVTFLSCLSSVTITVTPDVSAQSWAGGVPEAPWHRAGEGSGQ